MGSTPLRRRDLFILSGLGLVAVGVHRLTGMSENPLESRPIPGLPGFRRLSAGGSLSGSAAVFAGLDPVSEEQKALREDVLQFPCHAVFGPDGWTPDALPVAVFTDYNCPYCPVLSELVIDLESQGAPIRTIWYDLPVLGASSERAARAALAAQQQESYLPVHRHLMRAVLKPGPVALTQLAEQFGMDSQRFIQDAASPEVEREIQKAKAIAAVFGIVGTPAVLVGRTLVVGNVGRSELERLIDLEKDEPFEACLST